MSFSNRLIVSKRNIYCRWLRAMVRNQNFTIISDDCWGGQIYRELGVPYSTPFVGMFIRIPEYLTMLQNLDRYLNYKLEFINSDMNYPVAKLKDVHVFFQHYKSPQEAEEKWYKRCKRIKWDNLFVKIDFSKYDISNEQLSVWNELKFDRSIAISAVKKPVKNNLVINDWSNNGVEVYHRSKSYFAIWVWLNTGMITIPSWYSLAYRMIIGKGFHGI